MVSEKVQRVGLQFSRLIIVKIQTQGHAATTLFNEQLQSISQLIGTKKIESIDVITENAEEGYAVAPVNSDVNVLLLVKVDSFKFLLTYRAAWILACIS